MPYALNPLVEAIAEPPIAEAQSWIAGREFASDKPLLDLARAAPSYPPAESLRAYMAEFVSRPEASTYTEILGLPHLRTTLAAHMSAAYGGTIEAANTAITAGCNQAFCLAMTALAAPGDEVLLPVPYYFNYQMWLEAQGIRAIHLPFREDRGALPDPEDAARLMTNRTRALVLISPNNPTGAVYPPHLIEAFYELARERRIALVLDETYRDFLPDGTSAHTLFSRPDWPATLVQLYSFSKAYSLPGYRVGSMIADARLIGQVKKLMDCVAICAPRMSQEAAAFGLLHLGHWQREKRSLMQSKVLMLREAFRDRNLEYALVSCSAYFAYIRHPFRGERGSTVARRLADEQNLLCLPGSTFGPEQEQYLRFAFANLDAEQIPELGRRLLASQSCRQGADAIGPRSPR